MLDLKPCPFCGSKGKIRGRATGDFVPECTNTNCIASYMIGADFKTEAEAKKAWNERT